MLRLQTKPYRIAIALLVTTGLFATAVLVLHMPHMLQRTHMALAVSLDLVVTIPLIYLLLIRPTRLPNLSVVPVMLLGLVLGLQLLPESQRHYLLHYQNYVLPAIELSVLAVVVYKVRKALTQLRKAQEAHQDFFTALLMTCKKMVPKLAALPLAMEIAVFYYGFVVWKKPAASNSTFNYHKESGIVALLAVVLFLIAVETLVFHLLLQRWSLLAANIALGVSLYSGLQFWGFLKSIIYRPIEIKEGVLYLRHGIISELEVPLTDIVSVEQTQKDLSPELSIQKLSVLGSLEPHNLILTFSQPAALRKLYRNQRNVSAIALHLDDPTGFICALHEYRASP